VLFDFVFLAIRQHAGGQKRDVPAMAPAWIEKPFHIANYIDIYTCYGRMGGMKAYGLDLRERIVSFVKAGGSKVEAARRFRVARKTVYNYLALVQAGALAPKTSWGSWKKFEPAKVRA
jgi:hypothetical protein